VAIIAVVKRLCIWQRSSGEMPLVNFRASLGADRLPVAGLSGEVHRSLAGVARLSEVGPRHE
jgi:hypothetical protein